MLYLILSFSRFDRYDGSLSVNGLYSVFYAVTGNRVRPFWLLPDNAHREYFGFFYSVLCYYIIFFAYAEDYHRITTVGGRKFNN